MNLSFKKGIEEMTEAISTYPWHETEAYALYLSQTYYYVTHSTRLLALAAAHMKVSDNTFHRRFLEHASEEKGHDQMALKDLEALGFSLKDFPELPHTRMFWETQYYKIEHNDPLSLMGYVLALEALAGEQCPVIKRKLDPFYPKQSTNFIRAHAEDDPEHVVKAWAVIDALPPERRKWIEENFLQTVVSFHFMFEGMRKNVGNSKLRKAA